MGNTAAATTFLHLSQRLGSGRTLLALDHYVSQVHLRNFYSPQLGGLTYAMRKSDLKRFKCRSEDVCRIEEGSTNAYLVSDRAVEDFLRGVEPKYNAAVAKLRDGKLDHEVVFTIAGFIAYVTCCSPAAMRIHSRPLQASVETLAAFLDERNALPKSPESLGSRYLSELLAEGKVKIDIDPKFPQAIGIATIMGRISKFGNSHWQVIYNNAEASPFFTSDYPVALEPVGRIPNWIVPLTPTLAVRIVPDIQLSGAADDLSFAKFTSDVYEAERQEILAINRLLVKCAEDTVFHRDDEVWIPDFIAKYRHCRVEVESRRISTDKGFLDTNTQRIVCRQTSKSS